MANLTLDYLTLNLTYNMKDGSFENSGNIKEEFHAEIISDSLQSMMFTGRYSKEPEDREVYNISIYVFLADGSLNIESNTGNRALTAGILTDALSRLSNKKQDTT